MRIMTLKTAGACGEIFVNSLDSCCGDIEKGIAVVDMGGPYPGAPYVVDAESLRELLRRYDEFHTGKAAK